MDLFYVHGNNIPSEYVKISIKEIEQKVLQVPLQIKGPFHDNFLQCGIITAWKTSDMLRMYVYIMDNCYAYEILYTNHDHL